MVPGMLFDEKKITLKDGASAVLRAPRESDAAELICFMQQICSETDFLLRTPEECDMPLEEEQRFIRSINDAENRMMILCEVDGVIAGNCDLSLMTRRQKTRHRGTVGISIRQAYWGRGIGTALMAELIAAARQYEGITQLELEFLEGNSRARSLYEKMGFRLVGIRPNAYRLPDGKLHNEYIMMLEL